MGVTRGELPRVLDAGEVAVAAGGGRALHQHDLAGRAAWIGVPAGTPMSMPGWQDSHERDSQNGEVIGPLTGQIRPPRPGLTGPGREGRRSSARAWPGLRLRGWRLATSSSSSWRPDLAGQRPDHLAVLRVALVGVLPPGHRHRRPGGHADPRRRVRQGRADAGRRAPPAATATSPASSTPASLSTCYAHQSRFGTSRGRERHAGPGHRLRWVHRPVLRGPSPLRDPDQRLRRETHELPAKRACSPSSTSSA